MNPYYIIIYAVIFIYGIVIGSFLNVCIYRIPKRETIVTTPSHCMSCGYHLKWYDLVPIFSYVFLRGRCRQCRKRISIQYPVIEALNGVLWVLTFLLLGFTWDALFACLLISTLIVLSVIDWRTYEIPVGLNLLIGVLGVIVTVYHREEWLTHVIGFFAVSTILLIVYLLTKGNGIGGGDIKLMAVAGLLLGWKLIVVAFLFGCFFGSVIHLIRMKVSKTGHMLAMGPYLSAGILTALWFGRYIVEWYVSMFPE